MSRILSKADLEPRQEPEEKIVSLLPPNDIDVDYEQLHVVTAARNECVVCLDEDAPRCVLLPSSSRRWRRCPSTDRARALWQYIGALAHLALARAHLRLKCNCMPTWAPLHHCTASSFCSPCLRRWLRRRRRTASSCSSSSHRGLARRNPRRHARAPLAQHFI